jgi:ribonuclease BN (tRNA processing enzyme)
MRLTVLGCRAGMPGEGQAGSGYLVSVPGPAPVTQLLLDCGPGVATALSAVVHPRELAGVVISHFHLDHCYDVLVIGRMLLADHLNAGDRGERGPPAIPLYVPIGGRAVLDRLAALFPVGLLPTMNQVFELAFDVREYRAGDAFAIGDCHVTMHGLEHAVPNCGSRIESPSGSIAYTGDTGVTDELQRLARDVDLFLAEATLAEIDRGSRGHLSAADAARAAAAGGAHRLVLTHFTSTAPEWLRARRADAERIFTGPIEIATPGRELEVRPKLLGVGSWCGRDGPGTAVS